MNRDTDCRVWPALGPSSGTFSGRTGAGWRGVIWAILVIMGAFFGNPISLAAAELDLRRYEADVRKFERMDATNPPPADGVLFTGSSSIVKWAGLKADFPGIPVLNRGFGGSTWRELNAYFPRLVARYQPRAVVVYEGDNDLNAGRTVAECLADFDEFCRLMRLHLPEVPVAVLSVKPSPIRRGQRALQTELNAAIERRLAGMAHWKLLDVGRVLLDAHGEMRPELYEADQLHLKRAGYECWLPVMRTWVEKFGGP